MSEKNEESQPKEGRKLPRRLMELMNLKEGRTPDPAFLFDDPVLSESTQLSPAPSTQTFPIPEGIPPLQWLNFICTMGTGLWRLKQKMVQPGKRDQPLEEMQRAFRHFESIWTTFMQLGVEIHDHIGEPLPKGGSSSLKILEFESRPGLTCDTIVETAKPAIYFHNHIIQLAEVYVGTPEESEDPANGTPTNS